MSVTMATRMIMTIAPTVVIYAAWGEGATPPPAIAD